VKRWHTSEPYYTLTWHTPSIYLNRYPNWFIFEFREIIRTVSGKAPPILRNPHSTTHLYQKTQLYQVTVLLPIMWTNLFEHYPFPGKIVVLWLYFWLHLWYGKKMSEYHLGKILSTPSWSLSCTDPKHERLCWKSLSGGATLTWYVVATAHFYCCWRYNP